MTLKRMLLLVAAAGFFGYVLRHEAPSLIRYAKISRM